MKPCAYCGVEDPDYFVRQGATNALRKITREVLEKGAQTNGNFKQGD